MRPSLKIEITHRVGDEDVIDKYNSLSECATHYKISIPTLRAIMCKYSTNLHGLPQDATYKLIPSQEHSSKMWFCDICQKDVLKTSKSNHLRTAKHIKKTEEKNDFPPK
jgi:hypothetical protein